MLRRRWISADLVITVGFLLLFAWALLQALAWPFRTALFPVMTSSVVLALVLLKLALDLTGWGRARQPEAEIGHSAVVEEEEAAEAEFEDVFATAPPHTWLAALSWMALFFGGLWLLGAFVAVPLFALVYLLVASRESWLVAAAYAGLAWLFIYGIFDQLLHTPLPNGVLLEAFPSP